MKDRIKEYIISETRVYKNNSQLKDFIKVVVSNLEEKYEDYISSGLDESKALKKTLKSTGKLDSDLVGFEKKNPKIIGIFHAILIILNLVYSSIFLNFIYSNYHINTIPSLFTISHILLMLISFIAILLLMKKYRFFSDNNDFRHSYFLTVNTLIIFQLLTYITIFYKGYTSNIYLLLWSPFYILLSIIVGNFILGIFEEKYIKKAFSSNVLIMLYILLISAAVYSLFVTSNVVSKSLVFDSIMFVPILIFLVFQIVTRKKLYENIPLLFTMFLLITAFVLTFGYGVRFNKHITMYNNTLKYLSLLIMIIVYFRILFFRKFDFVFLVNSFILISSLSFLYNLNINYHIYTDYDNILKVPVSLYFYYMYGLIFFYGFKRLDFHYLARKLSLSRFIVNSLENANTRSKYLIVLTLLLTPIIFVDIIIWSYTLYLTLLTFYSFKIILGYFTREYNSNYFIQILILIMLVTYEFIGIGMFHIVFLCLKFVIILYFLNDWLTDSKLGTKSLTSTV